MLTAVQESIARGDIDARIEFIFLSREPGESVETDKFIELAGSYGIPVIPYSYQRYRKERGLSGAQSDTLPDWRLDYDREVMKRLEQYSKPDLCVLAGYMLIVGPEMCTRYTMINLHPAAPDGPAGTWQEVIWQLIDERAESSGVMIHLVTPELDKGPVVSYCRFPIRGKAFDELWREIDDLDSNAIKAREGDQNRLFQMIRRHGAVRELPLIVSTVKAFSEGRIKVEDGNIIDSQGKPINGYDLSGEIDRMVETGLNATL
ncbi:formyltransferase family protein [Dehalogenimonas sp. THU2]|uniref:phosphoribosylglycinamide formyltransferase n=1 Tax=Dehalogenimonas sp. THU2 TaxID=3151121 RepID=UPI003218776D